MANQNTLRISEGNRSFLKKDALKDLRVSDENVFNAFACID